MENKHRILIVIWYIISSGCIGTVISYCNFEQGLCNWKQQSSRYDDFNWTYVSGKTTNTNTCQVSDHTSGAGGYLYIHSKDADIEQKARLVSPKEKPGNYCLSFWYFVCGHNINELRIIVKRISGSSMEIFTTSDEKGVMWILKQLDISTTYQFKIWIEGWIKSDGFGVIAIDDIELLSNKCPENCGDPTPEFGLATNKDYEIGSIIQILCKSGYTIEGNALIECLSTGSWSNNPKCLPVDCYMPLFDEGMKYATLEGTSYNQNIDLECFKGYTLIGNASITCQADGHWSTMPKCVIKNCSDPTPASGTVSKRNFTYSSVINIECYSGYNLKGDSQIVCQDNATWSHRPVCDKIDCGDPTPKSGTIREKNFKYMNEVQVICNPGYKLKGHSKIICQANATWSGRPTCEILNCSKPALANGFLVASPSSTSYNEVIILACAEGYTLRGNDTVICRENGDWTSLPTCVDEESGSKALIATAVTVPLFVIGLLVLIIISVYRIRKGRCMKGDKNHQELAMKLSTQYANNTYNNCDLITDAAATDKSPVPNSEYAVISNENQPPEMKDVVYYNTVKYGTDLRKNVDYDHMKASFKPVLDNTYSHIQDNKNGLNNTESKMSPNSYSYTNAAFQEIDDEYNHINLDRPKESGNQRIKINQEQESDYDHAKAGGCDPVSLEVDEYSHLNAAIEGQRERVANISDLTLDTPERTDQERKTGYEEPIGHTPQYFVVEKDENTYTPEEDRHYFVLEKEEKYENYCNTEQHDYFILEKK